MTDMFRTMNDWEARYYDRMLAKLGGSQRIVDLLYKDDTVVATDADTNTVMYGARVYDNLYRESPMFQVIPKRDFATAKSGVRLLTADATAAAGIAEAAALNATDAPDITQFSITLKRMNQTFDITEKAILMGMAQDGKEGGESNWQLAYGMKRFAQSIDAALCATSGTTANLNMESFDRVSASSYEDTLCTDAANASFDAGDNDIYSQDRDSATTTDAYSLTGLTHNSGTDRALVLNIIDGTIAGCEANGLAPEHGLLMTKHDTYADLASLLNSQQRFNDYVRVTFDVNGVTSAGGREAGVEVAKYHGYPVFRNANVIAETSGSGRIYVMDTDGIEIRVASPVRHLMNGVGDAILSDAFVERHSIDMLAELTATKFSSHSKIRDLS